jgi:hypothetical protein
LLLLRQDTELLLSSSNAVYRLYNLRLSQMIMSEGNGHFVL